MLRYLSTLGDRCPGFSVIVSIWVFLPSLDYCNSIASHLLKFGGIWNNGTKCGMFYLNVNNGASNANANIGSHLQCMRAIQTKGWTSKPHFSGTMTLITLSLDKI